MLLVMCHAILCLDPLAPSWRNSAELSLVNTHLEHKGDRHKPQRSIRFWRVISRGVYEKNKRHAYGPERCKTKYQELY